MPIAVACPTCATRLKAPDTMLGKKVNCPKCKAPMTVTAPPVIRPAVAAPLAELDDPANEVVAARGVPAAPVLGNATGAALRECPFCSEMVLATAKKCKHCGETIDVALRMAEEAKRAAEKSSPMVFMNAAASSSSSSSSDSDDDEPTPEKSRMTAVVLAILLGGVGAHKFYLGQSFQGLLYLVFCMTFVPAILGLVDGIGYWSMSDRRFAQLYG